jgi:hypothetical protein
MIRALRLFAGEGARPLTIIGAGHEQSLTRAEAPPVLQASALGITPNLTMMMNQ